MSDHAVHSPDEPLPTRRTRRTHRTRRRRAGRRRVLVALGVVLLVLLAWVVAVAVSGYQAGRALQRVADRVPTLEQQVRAQDFAAATGTAAAVARDAAAADRATGQFPYRWAQHVPWVGDQLAAVRGGAHAAALLAGPLPGALQTAGNVVADGLVSADQRVDVEGLQELAPVLTDYRGRVEAARSALREGDSPRVLPAISSRLAPVAEQLDEVAAPLDTAVRVLPQLPPLLGADGPRTYLVAFTNPAEIRPVQGIVGAYAYLTIDRGAISLTATGTDNDLYAARADTSAVSAEFAALYGQDTSIVQNVTAGGSADEAGALTASLVTDAGLPTPDVVVFVDPVGWPSCWARTTRRCSWAPSVRWRRRTWRGSSCTTPT